MCPFGYQHPFFGLSALLWGVICVLFSPSLAPATISGTHRKLLVFRVSHSFFLGRIRVSHSFSGLLLFRVEVHLLLLGFRVSRSFEGFGFPAAQWHPRQCTAQPH